MFNYIAFEEVTKKFGSIVALNRITVNFEQGKIHGIIGRNGSGKTVLLKCLCGLMKADSGTIKINNHVVNDNLNSIVSVGAIIENPGFIQSYSGLRNLQVLADLSGKRKEIDINKAVELVGLSNDIKRKVKGYSLGMKQRLGVAQAIMNDPDLLILDEPMNGLDLQMVEQMRLLLESKKNEGKTILLASHSMEDIRMLCDTVIELDAGNIIRQDKHFGTII